MAALSKTQFLSTVFLTLFLIIFVSGYDLHPAVFAAAAPYNLHRALLLALLFVVLAALSGSQALRNKTIPLNRTGNSATYYTVALCATIILATLAQFTPFATFQITTYLSLVILAMSIASLPSRAILLAIAVSFTLHSTLSVLQMVAYSVQGIKPSTLDLAFGFSHVRFFNHIQTVFIPLLLGFALSRPASSVYRYALLLSVSLSLCMLVLTAGRGTSLALIGSAALFFIINKRQALRYAVALVACASLGIMLALALSSGWSADTAPIQLGVNHDLFRTNTPGRLVLWLDSVEQIAKHPFTGIGAGNYRYALTDSYVVAHSHNELITLATEYGLPVACAVLVIVSSLLCRLAQLHQQHSTNFIYTGAFIAIVSALIHAMFSGILMTATGQLALTLAVAITIRHLRSRTGVTTSAGGQVHRAVVAVSVILLTLAAGIQFTTGTFDMLSPNCESKPIASPRIWLNTDSPCFPKLE